VVPAQTKTFPFNFEDLKYFVIRRKDGLTVKYNIVEPETRLVVGNNVQRPLGFGNVGGTVQHVCKSLSTWCHHNPADKPLFITEPLDLYIADCIGFRNHYKEYTYAIDCGDILTEWQVRGSNPELLAGDRTLTKKLAQHVLGKGNALDTKILQIDWDDRKAPNLAPAFWPALVASMKGTSLIACQGGHGRSGTGAVCMMMVMNPEYSPADAIIHLRAVHCARAIESKEQHEYIGRVGEFLGRKNDIDRIGQVNSFKDAFFALKHKSAKPYQARLREEIEAGKAEKVDKLPY